MVRPLPLSTEVGAARQILKCLGSSSHSLAAKQDCKAASAFNRIGSGAALQATRSPAPVAMAASERDFRRQFIMHGAGQSSPAILGRTLCSPVRSRSRRALEIQQIVPILSLLAQAGTRVDPRITHHGTQLMISGCPVAVIRPFAC